MIDCPLRHRELARRSAILDRLGMPRNRTARPPYRVLALHQPSNLDHPKALEDIPAGLTLWRQSLQYSCPFTLELVKMSRASDCCGISPAEDSGERTGIVPLDRLGYLDFLLLNDRARMVLTDSDGVLAEATVLGVPCLTQRETTERPATVDQGTNQVVGVDPLHSPSRPTHPSQRHSSVANISTAIAMDKKKAGFGFATHFSTTLAFTQ